MIDLDCDNKENNNKNDTNIKLEEEVRFVGTAEEIESIQSAFSVNILYIAPEEKYCCYVPEFGGGYYYGNHLGATGIRCLKCLNCLLGCGDKDFSYDSTMKCFDKEDGNMCEVGNYYLSLGDDKFEMKLSKFRGDSYSSSELHPIDFKQNDLVIIDGLSSIDVQNRIKYLIENASLKPEKFILINADKKSPLLSLIPKENILYCYEELRNTAGQELPESIRERVGSRSKEVFKNIIGNISKSTEKVKVFPLEKNLIGLPYGEGGRIKRYKLEKQFKEQKIFYEALQETKSGGKFRKLFDKVKENKGKTVGGSVVFATLEELLRRSFFGGNETNKKQKTKNVEDSKKLVDSKDADQYSNKEDKNSAPN